MRKRTTTSRLQRALIPPLLLFAGVAFAAPPAAKPAPPTAPAAKPAPPKAPAAKPAPPAIRLMDARFAKLMCKGWNRTSLPKKLGRAGSQWIDQAGSKGRQVLVVSRRDCKRWRKVQLVIEADAKGNARCTSAGAFRGGKYQWKFEPKTIHWADFTDGFGSLKMPKIMSGFVGPYSTAMNNIGNFEVFFAMSGYLALKHKVDWMCVGADKADVKEEVADIDKGDMRKILRGMAILR